MKAILNIADTGALESTAHMLSVAGYKVARPNPLLINALRKFGKLENVLSVEDLVKDWGYSEPKVTALATVHDMEECDLFVDTKAHVNYPRIVKTWPRLAGKVLWCCLNGGDPEKRTDGEPWAVPPCPVLTNNLWYRGRRDSYACYPPYLGLDDYPRLEHEGDPICLVHNVERWGYGHILSAIGGMGVRFYGGNAPDGLIPHRKARELLQRAVAMVYMKTGDTVGYATVEALSTCCPLIVSQRYIDETRLKELFIPGDTCLAFGEDHAVDSIAILLDRLKDITYNRKIGDRGRERFLQLSWNANRTDDLDGFKRFLLRNFAGYTG